jgi:hypothetical protein
MKFPSRMPFESCVCEKEKCALYCRDISDIPQMFAKIPQFFSLSFFLKIALPIQAYVLETSQLLGYVPLMKALNSISGSFSRDNNFKLLSEYPKTIA